ncbi:MAG: TVP38/TMEM64 family protein [Lentisphaerae bacterium]|nr:TVP38/TMEM64 family protein [Lentisphaerota bacterium]
MIPPPRDCAWRWPPARRILAGAAMLALLGGTVEVLYHAGTIHAWLRNVDAARDWILQHGFWPSVLAFFAANLLLCAAGFPRLWTSVFAGAVFGGTLGLGLSLPSSVLGTCLTFFGARGIGSRRLLERLTGRWRERVELRAAPSLLQAILIRQLPVPGMALTLLLAMSDIPAATFAMSSALGFIPGAVIACYAGDTLATAQTQQSITVAAAIILVALLAMALLRRNARPARGQPPR